MLFCNVARPLLFVCALFLEISALQQHSTDAVTSANLRVVSALEETEAKRFAVVNAWFNSPEAQANNAQVNKDVLCPIALSLKTGSASVRTNLPDNLKEDVVIDKILYTNLSSFGVASEQFIRSRGIRVVNVEHDPAMADVKKRLGGSQGWTKMMTNFQKLSYLWATDYDGILGTDYDVFWTQGEHPDMLGTVAERKNGSMITFQTDAALVAGGVIAVHPDLHYREEFEKVAKVVSPLVGMPSWQGSYSKDFETMMFEKHRGMCSRQTIFPCCEATDPYLEMWCTAGGNADQGFLTHLAYDGQESRAEMRGQWRSSGCFQEPLDPKVWRADKMDELCKRGAQYSCDNFWKLWDTDFEPQMKDDQECTAYFQTNHQMYLEYLEREGCSKS
mmetsp:Transcript_116025/g.248042  ORF Transcript_116025/g.248042 Transcript_116025/m.248042 type:complete len:389 (+) Transcript_116025:45-1211(+)